MQAFLEPLKELADYQEIVSSRRKKTGFLQIAGCVNSQKIHLAKALSDGFEYRVIVFSSEEKAKQAYEEWRTGGKCMVLSGKRSFVLSCRY